MSVLRLRERGETGPTSRSRRRPLTLGKVTRHGLLLGACAIALYPIFFVVTTAMKTRAQYLNDPYGLAWPPYFGNFEEALRGGEFLLWFRNSAILAVGAVALGTLVAAFAAFAFARMDFRGRTFLFGTNVSLMVIPPIVMVIPLLILFTQLGLVSTFHGVILIYTGLTLPFAVYLLTVFFRAIPRSVIDAALIDGANLLTVLWRIVLPMAAPAFVTLVIVNALWIWNELLIALVFLPSDDLKTAMVGMTVFRSRYNLDVPVTMAGMLLVALPIAVLYLIGQRYFIRGLTAGGIRG